MKFVLINSDYEIAGFDIFNNRIKDSFWYTVDDDAYQYCMAHNAQVYIKNTNDIAQKISLFDARRDAYATLEDPDKIPILLTVDDLGYEKQHDIVGVRINKRRKHSILCREAIEAGIVYTLNNDRKRFTYSTIDQLNYAELESLINDGIFENSEIPIKASGDEEYSYVSKKTFEEIYNMLRYNKYYNLFYLRVLNEYMEEIDDPIILEKMTFEVALPEKYTAKLDNYLAPFKKRFKEAK